MQTPKGRRIEVRHAADTNQMSNTYIAHDPTGYHAAAWYDPYTHLWTCYTSDSEGNQIGSANYEATKAEAIEVLDLLIERGNHRADWLGVWAPEAVF